jgi:hypothetical protein
MATNTKLAPWRQYHEVDVINMFSYSGSIPVTAGTLVAVAFASGWRSDEANNTSLGAIGASYANVISNRWGTYAAVKDAGTGDNVIGMLLNDVREQDENGQLYKFYPRKAAENNHVMSGWTSPILTKGFVMISGAFNGAAPVAGSLAYASGAGNITTNPDRHDLVSGTAVGKFYGGVDGQGFALLRLNC